MDDGPSWHGQWDSQHDMSSTEDLSMTLLDGFSIFAPAIGHLNVEQPIAQSSPRGTGSVCAQTSSSAFEMSAFAPSGIPLRPALPPINTELSFFRPPVQQVGSSLFSAPTPLPSSAPSDSTSPIANMSLTPTASKLFHRWRRNDLKMRFGGHGNHEAQCTKCDDFINLSVSASRQITSSGSFEALSHSAASYSPVVVYGNCLARRGKTRAKATSCQNQKHSSQAL
ncbi:hypothetical protein C8F01DRAFT_1150275 [Mycena amicta]|nr:hypothetical protein C8F01DRAFT_1150275 [Mycena amicta]